MARDARRIKAVPFEDAKKFSNSEHKIYCHQGAIFHCSIISTPLIALICFSHNGLMEAFSQSLFTPNRVESVLSADSKYEACMPQSCGIGPNISYPFWIHDKSEDFCGKKGFDVACERNKPIYKTSGAHYLIEDISYDNQSFHLVDVEVLDTTCFARRTFLLVTQKRVVACAFAANQTILISFVALVPRGKHHGFSASVPCESLVFAPVELTEENSSV
ncbi:hypothetical protein RHGRI_033786 [Rhododendron griersonianum]|uniref:Wall-associated receptor kinase galacturonan-binding domain-containing protein n=1 Tax=Rhododendron griersonianum TaxID=479676 RepID=A0AAV6HYF7_9ERIC|nr:hypothetical protein RHGRI_033786 [Rhododendron griersonianum]